MSTVGQVWRKQLERVQGYLWSELTFNMSWSFLTFRASSFAKKSANPWGGPHTGHTFTHRCHSGAFYQSVVFIRV